MQIVQVYPTEEYQVYLYFADGHIKLYDARPLLKKDGAFASLQDPQFFLQRCTVLNGTLAWDLSGRFDPTNCIDLDPEVLYANSVSVLDPLAETG